MYYIHPEFPFLAEFCTKSDMIEIIIARWTVQDRRQGAGGDGVEESTQLFEEFFFNFAAQHMGIQIVPG